ncbi:MAG: restriction endonuclease, partial [Oscillatoria sp. PMC 1076.18]|nr:restriction endonuclease [Oscillatoria sp. PMC 1076.18]
VVSRQNKYVAIEISFQVTTNSVIERKAGQAKSRFEQINSAGYKIAYILDGAGNFQRENALSTLCFYSHCCVAFSQGELNVLCDFIKNYFAN